MWFDLPQQRSFKFRDVKSVLCRTTATEKLRCIVVLSALADGIKLRPMIIFKGLKNIPKSDFPKEIVVTAFMKVSMNSDLMNIYKQKVWTLDPIVFLTKIRLSNGQCKTSLKNDCKIRFYTTL